MALHTFSSIKIVFTWNKREDEKGKSGTNNREREKTNKLKIKQRKNGSVVVRWRIMQGFVSDRK